MDFQSFFTIEGKKTIIDKIQQSDCAKPEFLRPAYHCVAWAAFLPDKVLK